MTKQEYFSTALPHGLKVEITGKDNEKRVVSVIGMHDNGIVKREDGTKWHWLDVAVCHNLKDRINGYFYVLNYTPILRPLSDLTKECVQAHYNNGEPFTPMDEFEFLAVCDADRNWISAVLDDFSSVDCKLEVAPFHFIKLLIKWHFDLITEDCEKVYVSETFNPYK